MTNPHRSSRRLAVGVASVAAGLAIMLTPLGASSQVVANETSAITITQTPAENQGGDCVPASLAILNGTLSAYPVSDASTFVLNIHAAAPLCDPIPAKAVVYKMPAQGEWPQTLAEVKDFSIQAAGDTVITFAKLCDRVQYDVITGDAPNVINTGFDQTLLFPGNLQTAFQHVGNGPGCAEATTTVAPTTTVATTTTAVVRAESTVAPTTIRPAVLAATTVPVGSDPNGLAVTGSTSGPFALMGGGLVFIGLAFMMASHRRRA